MPLKVYIGEKFSHKHETEIFNSLIKKLKEQYDKSDELVILVGNFYYNNQEIDATIFKKNAVIVIDFKKYSGAIKFSENGKWYAGNEIIKGGNKINPFVQLRTNKFALVNFFKNNHYSILKSNKEINYGHIQAMVIFHNKISFQENTLPYNLQKWFHITDFDHCIEIINKLTDEEISFTNEEILNIIKVLNVTDYYSFDKSDEINIKNFNSIKVKHELTKSQLQALNFISEFIENKDKKIFILNGAAGTGKTYLIKEIVNLLLEKEKSDFKILAPTGRACSNIREKIIHDVRTIHSQIYERSPDKEEALNQDGDEDTKIYELNFKIKKNIDSEETVYIIDECSLLSDNYYKNEIFNFGSNKLLSDVLNYIRLNNSNRKIILIGDDKQIQRGKCELSSLNRDYFNKEHNIETDSFELNEIVRYKENSSILKNALKIRKSIKNNAYNEFIIDSDEIDIFKLNRENIKDYYHNLDKTNTVIIKYTNKDCNRTNQWVKTEILQKNVSIDVGDILMFHKNYFLRKTNSSSEYPEFDYINNGEVGIVKWISASPEIINQVYGRGIPKKIRLAFRDIKIRLSNGKEYAIKIFENYLFSDESEINREELIGLIVRFTKDYKNKYNEYPNPKKIGVKKYYEAIQSDEYFNSARVKHAYSITCHKSQGSEWKNVVVDFSGFTGYKEDFFRWSYTAITRAVEKLYIINDPKIHPYVNINWADNSNCLDFSINNILFFNKSNTTKTEIQELSSILSIPSNIPEFSELFSFLYEIFLKNKIVIDKVEHNFKGYYVRYYLKKSDKITALNFIFDGQYKFKKPTIVKNATNDEKFAIDCLEYICNNNYEYDLNISISTTENIFIKSFIIYLHEKLNSKNIKILLIEHLNYIERIFFGKNKDLCIIDFYYNDNNFITSVRPEKTNSIEIVEEVKTLINDLKNLNFNK